MAFLVHASRCFLRCSSLQNSGFVSLRTCSNSISVAEKCENTLKSSDDCKSSRDVPFLYLPHTVKKAYVVHEASTTLPKVFDKYKWLTKTISTPQIPEIYENAACLEDEQIVKAFHDSLQKTVAYQKNYKNKGSLSFSDERIKYNFASNLLRIAMLSNSSKNHLQPENSMLYHDSILETHWPRNYQFFQTKFRPTFCLRTRNGLGVIEEPQALSEDEVNSIPGPYDNYGLNVHRQHIVHLLNKPGMDNSRFNTVKHCHTTVVANSRIRSDEQFYALGTFTSFAQLISLAQSSGVLHSTELKTPLVTHTIVTNGRKMAFFVYQLNTMYLLDDKNIWNRCWYSPVFNLYDNKENVANQVFEDACIGNELKGFKKDVCKYILNFIGRETLE